MARYNYTRENVKRTWYSIWNRNRRKIAMDEFDDEIAVGFSGNGYL